jgi:hypothetical protein
MATPQASTHAFPAQDRAPRLTITSEEISRYAGLTSLISKLQKEETSLRVELLGLYSVGAEQGTGSPYLLKFVEQECRTVDWNTEAWKLAEKLYGFEKAARWMAKAEESGSVTPTTEIQIEPNPSFAAGLANLAGSMWFDASSSAADERFGG